MGNNVNVFYESIREQQPVFKIHVDSRLGSAIECLLHKDTVFWMDPFEHAFQSRRRRCVVTEDAKGFFRPEQFFCDEVPTETACQAQLLGLGQIRFATSERVVCLRQLCGSLGHQPFEFVMSTMKCILGLTAHCDFPLQLQVLIGKLLDHAVHGLRKCVELVRFAARRQTA